MINWAGGGADCILDFGLVLCIYGKMKFGGSLQRDWLITAARNTAQSLIQACFLNRGTGIQFTFPAQVQKNRGGMRIHKEISMSNRYAQSTHLKRESTLKQQQKKKISMSSENKDISQKNE